MYSLQFFSVLSTKQVRVFVPVVVGKEAPTVVVTDVKETNFKKVLTVDYNAEGPKEVKFTVKPYYGRVFFSAHCTEHKLDTHKVFEPLAGPYVDYSKCVKSLTVPYTVSTLSLVAVVRYSLHQEKK